MCLLYGRYLVQIFHPHSGNINTVTLKKIEVYIYAHTHARTRKKNFFRVALNMSYTSYFFKKVTKTKPL